MALAGISGRVNDMYGMCIMKLYAEVEDEEERRERKGRAFFSRRKRKEKCAGWRMGIYVVCLCLCFVTLSPLSVHV